MSGRWTFRNGSFLSPKTRKSGGVGGVETNLSSETAPRLPVRVLRVQ